MKIERIPTKGRRGEAIKHLRRLGLVGSTKMRGVKRQKKVLSPFEKALKLFREGKIDWLELKRTRLGEKGDEMNLRRLERELGKMFFEVMSL